MLLAGGTFEDTVMIDPGFYKTRMSGNGVDNRKIVAPFAPGIFMSRDRVNSLHWNFSFDLYGNTQFLGDNAGGPQSRTDCVKSFDIDGVTVGTYSEINQNGSAYLNFQLKRSPIVGIDAVKWTGNTSITGTSVRTISHALGVQPDLMVLWSVTFYRIGTNTFINYAPFLWFREIATVGYPPYSAVPWGNMQFTDGSDNVYTDDNQQIFDDGIMSAGNISIRNGNFAITNTLRVCLAANVQDVNHVALLAASVENIQKIKCYTGTGASQKFTLNFQPDTILFFRFDNNSKHICMTRDSTTPNRDYIPLNDGAPATNGSDMLSWDADGFTLTSSMAWNASGAKCAFWAWKSGY